MGSIGQRPGLDGVRALAIAAVLLYHGQVPHAPGGFFGVDIFFVLSGFLITSLLLDERTHEGTIRLRGFWLRRARRLLPAAFLVVAVSLVVIAAWHPTSLAGLRGDAVAAVFYVNNWHLIVEHRSYFAAFQRPSLLQHYWSLAVEEQFYLLWPLALLALRRWPRRRIAWVALAGALASGLLMAALYRPFADPSRVYFGTDTRAMPILVGVALACLWPVMGSVAPIADGPRRLLDAAGIVGAAVLVLAIVEWPDHDTFVYRGGLAVVAGASALLVASAAHPESHVSRVLGSAPMVWIGRRSYGMYLWHWPVMALSRPGIDVTWSLWVLVPVQCAITVALAALSYRYVEMPIRTGAAQRRFRAALTRLRPAGRRAAVSGTAAVAAGFVLAVAVWPAPAAVSPVARPASSQALVPPSQLHAQPTHPRGRAVTHAVAPRHPVLMVGASVMLAAIRPLHDLLHATVDAKVGRQPSEILSRIHDYRKAHALPPVVAVQIGENGPFSSGDAQYLRRILRGVPRVILINLRDPNEWWISDANKRLARLARGWPEAVLADWHDASANPRLLWDGAHPNPQGALVYARTVRAAIDS